MKEPVAKNARVQEFFGIRIIMYACDAERKASVEDSLQPD